MTSDRISPLRQSWRHVASPGQIWMLRAVWTLGTLAMATAVALLVSAVSIHSQQLDWQPDALLGLVAGLFAVSVLISGLLVRFGTVVAVAGSDDRH